MFEGVGSLWMHSYPQGARATLYSAVEMIQHARIRDKARTTMAAIDGEFLQAPRRNSLAGYQSSAELEPCAFLPKLPQLGSYIKRGRLTADTFNVPRMLGLCFPTGES